MIKQTDLIGEKTRDIYDDYDLIKQLGSGSYSIVYEAQHKITKNFRCVKKVNKANFSKEEEENIMNEIKILTETDHPNVLKIMEYYQNEKSLFIIMEKLDGGELFDRIVEQKHLSEKEAQRIFRQMMSAIAYLHKRSIIHRDLKPENLMFESKKPDSPIKIIDFGTSRKFRSDQKLKAKMGTAYYIAPEVLNKSYDEKCDIWSAGIILYILLCGYPPFNGKSDDIIFSKIKEGKFIFPKEEWSRVSQEAQELIKAILVLDPAKRPTADQILSHRWVIDKDIKINPDLQTAAMTNLINFKAESQLQRAIMLYFVTFYDIKEEKNRLEQVFKMIDKDGDGQLTREELKLAVSQNSNLLDTEKIDNVFKKLDFNDTKTIDFSEFVVANYNYKKNLNKTRLRELFTLIDEDRNGQISCSELMKFFHFNTIDNEKMIKQMIDEVDLDKNGSISLAEFEKAMENLAGRANLF